MTTPATLDGMTAEQFIDICVGIAIVRTKDQIHRVDDPLFREMFESAFKAGANAGAYAAFSELVARGLIRERP